jgi:iron-sulfur cluster assembly accessory protein
VPEPKVNVLPAAEKFMRRMLRFSEHPGGGFRLAVAPGGCSGYASTFSLEAAPQAGDIELAVNGLRVFLSAESGPLLDGVTIGFADTALQSGFTFVNPNLEIRGCATAGAGQPPADVSISIASIKRR